MTSEMPWIAALLALVVGPYLGYLGAKQGFQVTATTAAREQATQQVESFYGRIVEDNRRLAEANDQHEARVVELTSEMLGLQRRVGTYEADLARLQRENEMQRTEIDRLANRLTQEALEKQKLSQHLISEQREKNELLRRVVKLEGTLASMAGIITMTEEGDG